MMRWIRPTALAEVDPSELVSPAPDFVLDPDDPDDPFWEQESEDDVGNREERYWYRGGYKGYKVEVR
jgi:hypothetical protein